MSKEALKLALVALDIVKIHYTQNRHVNEAITAIKEALSSPNGEAQPEQEPAFHGFMDEQQCCVNICYTPWAAGGPNNKLPTAYYTAPPQRKPLTDEQIVAKAMHLSGLGTHPDVVQFARAIEAAHGIKGGE